MSLGKTLLKVAIGIAIAKGVSTMTKGAGAGTSSGGGATGRGTPYDGGRQRAPGGLEDMMGDILGNRGATGRTTQSATPGDGFGDLLDSISGKRRARPRASAPKGGLDDLLGQLTGTGRQTSPRRDEAVVLQEPNAGSGGLGGGLGDLLGGLLGAAAGAGRDAGGRLSREAEAEVSAALMLRAMIQAVKADGTLDAAEKERLTEAMGDATPAEIKAVNAELQRPVDVGALASQVPAGMEAQVYLISLMALDLDQRAEAEYLHSLAQALEMTPEEVNAIHARAGVQALYT